MSNNVKLTKNGLNLIKSFEGYREKAYKDSAGIWTCGYGHTKGVNQNTTCTKALAESWLEADCANAVKSVQIYQNIYNFKKHEQQALISFAYNIGNIRQLTSNGTRTKTQIAEKMLLYNKAGGKVINGLTKRREKEREVFLNGFK